MILLGILLGWLAATGSCVPEFPNCAIYTANSCVQCSPGYFLDKADGACRTFLTCPTTRAYNCEPCLHLQCATDGQPAVCLDSYYLRATPEGLVCKTCKSAFCGTCNEDGECKSCIQGYGKGEQSQGCTPCIKGCQKCQDSNSCETCYPSFAYNPGTKRCDLKGPYIGMFIDRNYNMAKCSQQCKYCTGEATNCTECSDGYYMKRTLVEKCTLCAASCLTCVNQTFCTSCRSGVLQYYKCVQGCSDSEYFSDAEGMCKSCDSLCLSCNGTRNFCQACRDPIQYALNTTTGECKARCPTGQFAQATNPTEYAARIYTSGYGACANCSVSCSSCVNSSYCVKCREKYANHMGSCVQYCPTGFYGLVLGSKQTRCRPCMEGCTNCTNSFECHVCAPGFTLNTFTCLYNNPSPCANGKWINEICVASCPQNTVVSSTNISLCSCSATCSKCVYDVYSQLTICLVCSNSSWYEYRGACFDVCPSGTFSLAGKLYASFYTLNRCFTRCPEGYRQSGSSCVVSCPDSQYSAERYCLPQPTAGSYLSYDKLYNNTSPSTVVCLPNCDKCVSGNQCLLCSNGYFKQNATNGNGSIVCLSACQTNDYIVVPGSNVCQPCHYNCTQCISYLSFIPSTSQCSIYCDGNRVSNGTRTICQPSRQILITLFGTQMPNGLYSYIQPITIQIKNTYSQLANYDDIQLSSMSLLATIRSFSPVVRDYYQLNITLNTTVLKAGGIFNFFVKDEDVLNSTQFTTAQAATASFQLDSTTFEPLKSQLNLTIINFNGSGTFPFTYEFYLMSDSDPLTMFKTGFANISTLTNYVILFSVPFTQADNGILLKVRLFTLYSEIWYVENLESNSSAAGQPASKLNTVDSQLNFATTSNYSLLTDSFRSIVGNRYKSSPKENPCAPCQHGSCKLTNGSMACQCADFFSGRYCAYETTIWNQVQSIQAKLINLLKSNSRRLLVAGLTVSDRLQIMLSVVTYPDAMSNSQVVTIQNNLDGITSVGSFEDADAYVQIVTYLAAAADTLGMDILDYIKAKLVTAGQLMKGYLTQPVYYINQNNIEFRMINSDNFYRDILLSNTVPLLKFQMPLWKVTFYYKDLSSGTYNTPLYPYAASIGVGNNSWYYFEVGDHESAPLSLQLPILLADNKIPLYECRSSVNSTNITNNSCAVSSMTWTEFRLKDKPIPPEKSHAMTVYAVIIYATVVGLIITAEVLHWRQRIAQSKINSETSSHNAIEASNSRKKKRKRDNDELTSVGGAHENSIQLGSIPIEKDVAALDVQNFSVEGPPSLENTSAAPNVPVTNPENNFTYYHLLKDSLNFPEYLYILSFVLEFESCHLAVTTLASVSYGLAFIISLVLLAPIYYNLMTLMSRCCKACVRRRGTPIFLLLMLALVLSIIAFVGYTLFSTQVQFTHWGLTLPVFVLQAGLKDVLIFLYCRHRNEQKHTLASLLRRYVRWQRLINHVEQARQELEP